MTEPLRYDLREMVLRLAHQIRNPLATIKSGIQLVQHLQPEGDEVQEYLDAALVEVERINRTIADMQRVIRLESATAVSALVAGIVEEATGRCADSAHAAGITFVSRGRPDLKVFADRSQLVDAVAELIHNAVEFSPQGSTVVVSWEGGAAHRVRIGVTDACGGIPSAAAQRIFNPFHSTSTRGTGLGLNIVQRICELGGGRLEWGNLDDGSGCRFTIVMPGV